MLHLNYLFCFVCLFVCLLVFLLASSYLCFISHLEILSKSVLERERFWKPNHSFFIISAFPKLGTICNRNDSIIKYIRSQFDIIWYPTKTCHKTRIVKTDQNSLFVTQSHPWWPFRIQKSYEAMAERNSIFSLNLSVNWVKFFEWQSLMLFWWVYSWKWHRYNWERKPESWGTWHKGCFRSLKIPSVWGRPCGLSQYQIFLPNSNVTVAVFGRQCGMFDAVKGPWSGGEGAPGPSGLAALSPRAPVTHVPMLFYNCHQKLISSLQNPRVETLNCLNSVKSLQFHYKNLWSSQWKCIQSFTLHNRNAFHSALRLWNESESATQVILGFLYDCIEAAWKRCDRLIARYLYMSQALGFLLLPSPVPRNHVIWYTVSIAPGPLINVFQMDFTVISQNLAIFWESGGQI